MCIYIYICMCTLSLSLYIYVYIYTYISHMYIWGDQSNDNMSFQATRKVCDSIAALQRWDHDIRKY